MKRKVSLYIDGALADLNDQGLILFNWSFADIENPTAVRNSYSQQVTLPATPANDAIFGHYYRLDHTSDAGFRALVKTPFKIFSDTGELLESGYLRLDSIASKGRVVQSYSVSLFGGLGSFFWALSYNDDGSKKTLADLDYMGDAEPDELDFTINAAAVQAAWSRLGEHHGLAADKWDVINFAPAYEGIPDANFNADKGLITAADCGQPDHVDVDEGGTTATYSTKSGKLLVKLPKAVDEWAAKDLRSYLQRPVLSMEAFLYAVADLMWGGAQLDLSAVPTKCYYNLWKTLPLIPSLTTEHEEHGTAAVTTSSSPDEGPDIGSKVLAAELDTSHKVTANFNPSPRFVFDSNDATLRGYASAVGSPTMAYVSFIFLQWVAEDGNGNAIAGSPVKCVGGLGGMSVESVANAMSFTPVWAAAGFTPAVLSTGSAVPMFTRVSSGVYRLNGGLQNIASGSIVSQGAYRWRLYAHAFCGLLNTSTGTLTKVAGGTSARAYAFTSATVVSPSLYADDAYFTDSTSSVSYSVTTEGRTGTIITKQRLLASKHTPAEYLIGWAKTFGLIFVYDGAAKLVRVIPRNDYFNGGDVDLTTRVDRSRDVSVTPLNCGSRWYDFRPEMAEGAWAKEYAALYGIPYGIQRVDTGYQFNDEVKNIVEGLPFRGAASKLDHGRYWFHITQGGVFRPAVFRDNGVTCIYWGTGDKQYENPVSILTTASVTPVNENGHSGYDVESAEKVELRDDADKGIEGEDILLWHVATNHYDNFKVSDDTALMLALNNGVPCWDMDPNGPGLGVPAFQRCNDYYETWRITQTLDFGLPKEMDVPYVILNDDASLYAKYWAAFLRDRLDEDTKVLRCRVNLQGLQAGPDLLRRFWWYGGSWWVLNKIVNYSLTTWDPVECEFIQVQDKANYTDGQDY